MIDISKLEVIMSQIFYGYMDIEGNRRNKIANDFAKNYITRSPEEVRENGYGICFDQVEVARQYFESLGVECKTYFLVYYDNKTNPCHTFLVYKDGEEYVWYEHAWQDIGEIHYTPNGRYYSLENLLQRVRSMYVGPIKQKGNKEIIPQNYCLYEYTKPSYGLSVLDFYKHCEAGVNKGNINIRK